MKTNFDWHRDAKIRWASWLAWGWAILLVTMGCSSGVSEGIGGGGGLGGMGGGAHVAAESSAPEHDPTWDPPMASEVSSALAIAPVPQATACTSGSQCPSGFCVDGFCCDTSCDYKCMACSAAKKGSGVDGVCGSIKYDTDPDNDCPFGACDGKNACKNYNGFACTSTAQCLSNYCVDGVCCGNICMGACQACSAAKKGSGSDGVCGNIAANADPDNECTGSQCNGAGACLTAQTTSPNGTACTSAAQCASGFCADGVCCDSWCLGTCQACTAAKKMSGVDGVCGPIANDKDPDEECWGGACNGAGVCKQYNGIPCTDKSQCLSNYCVDGFCCGNICTQWCYACSAAKKGQGGDGTCGPIVSGRDVDNECSPGECNGTGACNQTQTPLANGTACLVGAQCASGNCVDGVCCDTACTETCKACSAAKKGSGANGTCGNIASETDPDSECGIGGRCGGNGTCRYYNSASCTTGSQCFSNYCVDGVCCGNICTSTCYACSAAKKGQGSDGACGPIANTRDPDNECNPGECNGSGACNQSQTPQANGAACVVASQCISGFCVDGFCCENACTGTCQACSAAKKGSGTNGTCGNIKYDTNPDNECPNGACSGTGTCQQYNGLPCMTAANCLSNYCVDGVCCGNICTNKCYACTAAKKGSGPDGQCGPIASNTDPDNECELSCSGTGSCQKTPNGSACTVASDCLSNFCVDGFCCDTACTGTCQACSAAKKAGGANGTCGPIATDTDPDNECPLGKCNGAGVCTVLLANGAACTTNDQCGSEQCVDGVCCNTACTGSCVACNLTGTVGTCTPIASGQSDPTGTPPCNNICDGNGGCVKPTGAACTSGSECVGRVCERLVCKDAAPGDDLLVWRTIWEMPPYWSGPYPTLTIENMVADDGGSINLDGDTPCYDQTPCALTGGFSATGYPLLGHWDGSSGTYHSFWRNIYKAGPYAATASYQKVTQFGCSGNWGDGYSTYIAGNRAGRTVHIAQSCDTGPFGGNGTDFGDGNPTYGPVLVRDMASGPNQVTGTLPNIVAPMAYGPSSEIYSIALSGGLAIYKSPAGGGATTLKSVAGSIGSRGFDVDAAGNLLIAFSFTGSVNFGAGAMTATGTDLGLVKLDPNGNVVWQRRYAGSVGVTRLAAGENGFGVLAVGSVNLGYGTTNGAFVARFDTLGTALWHANPNGLQDTNNSGAVFGVWSASIPWTTWSDNYLIGAEKFYKCSGASGCKREGAACTANDQCGSGFCVDGVCCSSACDSTCQACTAAIKGYGVDGVCEGIVVGTDPENECPTGSTCGQWGCVSDNGQACAFYYECASGFCTDGVCCDEQCSGTCRSCLAAKKGSGMDGQCGFTASGSDPDNECGGGICDGAGTCSMMGNGTACSTGNQCASTFCVDGVCCDTACSGFCDACTNYLKGSGATGTCGPIVFGRDVQDECVMGACNGANACIHENGIACANNAECGSTFCVDGVCCSTPCTGTCEACSAAKKGSGFDGTCGAIAEDTDPDTECGGAMCNGAGSCWAAQGEPCSVASECLSGFCRDGVCCDMACTDACMACTAAQKGYGTDGACDVITSGTDPDGECEFSSCNGSGACTPIPCMTDAECLAGRCNNGVCTHRIMQASSSGYVMCTRFYNGKVKCWGQAGRQGLEDLMSRGCSPTDMGHQLPFVNMGTNRTIQQLSGANSRTCALLGTNDVTCWGEGHYGSLGRGDTNALVGDQIGEMGDNLILVDLGTGKKAVQVAVGAHHTCARLTDNSVKCWGENGSGTLGLGDTQDRGTAPNQMGDALPVVALGTGKTAVAMAAGNASTCVILNDGNVKCWGSNGYGRLGLGDMTSRGRNPGEMGDNLPTVNLGTGKTAVQIAAGFFHFCAILNDQSVKCWGNNSYGQLGLGDTNDRGDAPGEMGDNLPTVNLGTGKTAVRIVAGLDFTCALLNDGHVKCWGANGWGQLGLGLSPATRIGDAPGEMGDNLPTVNLGAGRTVIDMTTGPYYTCAILDDNSVKCWGGNGRCELGKGSAGNVGMDPSHMGDNLPAVQLF